MKIQFIKLEQDIKAYSEKGPLCYTEAPDFTKLLIFRSWLKLQSAKKRLEALKAEFLAEIKSEYGYDMEIRKKFHQAVKNLDKAKKRQHITKYLKSQVAYDLGLINGDELFIVNELKSSGLGNGRVPVKEEFVFTKIIKPLLEAYKLEAVPA